MAESNVDREPVAGGEVWEQDDIEGRQQFLYAKHRLDGPVFIDGGETTVTSCEHTPEEGSMKRDREDECESPSDTAEEDEKIAQYMQVANSIIDAMMWRAEVGRRSATVHETQQEKVVKRETWCAVCSNAETPPKRCAGCKTVYYCSRQCQLQDWPFHRQTCLEQRPQAAAAVVGTVASTLNK
jgi:hypothetical protein